MELKLAALQLEQMRLQRNLFLVFVVIILVSDLLLTIQLFRSKEKIIMVPGIFREMQVSDNGVSDSYLEESSLLFLSALLDLTPETVEHKKDIILKYTSNSNKRYIQQIKEYFANSAQEHKKFNLTTYFTPKNLKINSRNLQVTASGVLSSNFGKKGYKEEQVEYVMNFEHVARQLKLKEFYRLQDSESDVYQTQDNTRNKFNEM